MEPCPARRTSTRRSGRGVAVIKLSDYVMQRLADWGVRHIFLVTGGGAMHLNDSIGKESRLQFICNHHEQAAAMSAEGYARIAGTPGVDRLHPNAGDFRPGQARNLHDDYRHSWPAPAWRSGSRHRTDGSRDHEV